MHFNAKTFVSTVKTKLVEGETALMDLIDAFLWAQRHLKEVHRVNPDYEQRWLSSEIRRIFNVDIGVFVRTARRLGGGGTQAAFNSGKALIKRFGVYESFRADRLLSEDQMAALRSQIKDETRPDEFRSMVDRQSAVLERLKREALEKQDQEQLDYKREYFRLRAEKEKLTKENERLKKELEQLKQKFSHLKELVV